MATQLNDEYLAEKYGITKTVYSLYYPETRKTIN